MKSGQVMQIIGVIFFGPPLIIVIYEWSSLFYMILKDIGRKGFIVIGLSVIAILALAFCLLLVVWLVKWLWFSLPI